MAIHLVLAGSNKNNQRESNKMKFKNFLKEESVFTYTDSFTMESVKGYVNPSKKDMRLNCKGVVFENGTCFITEDETVHLEMLINIKRNFPEYNISNSASFIVNE